jgi:hypothetical protein
MRDLKTRSHSDDVNPDANVAKINVGGGPAGLLITLGLMGMIVVGLPAARWFLATTVPAGLIVTLILHYTARDR